ncbi:hypothetical protein [Aquabacterium sp.]|uniref:hypothetical protein n=1 Tax=Aquabacterium sp. TaxID=1872578 RepID=UPI0025BD46E5|nr:hypothetical protein [Aquabacterium sp.]
MAVENVVLLTIVIALAIFDAYVSWLVLRAASFSRNQKIAQITIVYVFPLFGGILVWSFIKSDGQGARFDPSAVIDRTEKGANIAVDVTSHTNH